MAANTSASIANASTICQNIRYERMPAQLRRALRLLLNMLRQARPSDVRMKIFLGTMQPEMCFLHPLSKGKNHGLRTLYADS